MILKTDKKFVKEFLETVDETEVTSFISPFKTVRLYMVKIDDNKYKVINIYSSSMQKRASTILCNMSSTVNSDSPILHKRGKYDIYVFTVDLNSSE
jgi:hypothetical protein